MKISCLINSWNATKARFREKVVTLNICNRREERTKINHQASILRKFKKRKNINPKNQNRRNNKIRTEISNIENKKSIEKINKKKS